MYVLTLHLDMSHGNQSQVATAWPFSMYFHKMADQNIKQDTFKSTCGQSNPYI